MQLCVIVFFPLIDLCELLSFLCCMRTILGNWKRVLSIKNIFLFLLRMRLHLYLLRFLTLIPILWTLAFCLLVSLMILIVLNLFICCLIYVFWHFCGIELNLFKSICYLMIAVHWLCTLIGLNKFDKIINNMPKLIFETISHLCWKKYTSQCVFSVTVKWHHIFIASIVVGVIQVNLFQYQYKSTKYSNLRLGITSDIWCLQHHSSS